jgi:hypothetical protein
MPLKQDAGTDFASVLSSAMQSPEGFDGKGLDLPDGFPLPRQDSHRTIDTSEEGIPGIIAYDFKIHRKVFVIFRPWGDCARCGQDIAASSVSLPESGDYDCPHTSLDEYETIVNDILAGKFLFGSEQEITQKDGSVLVSLRWYEKTPSKKKKPQVRVDGTSPEPDL